MQSPLLLWNDISAVASAKGIRKTIRFRVTRESGSEAGAGGALLGGKKKRDFFLRVLIRGDAAKIIAGACFSARWHQKKCPTDRKKSYWALQTITLKLGGAKKSGPTFCRKMIFHTKC